MPTSSALRYTVGSHRALDGLGSSVASVDDGYYEMHPRVMWVDIRSYSIVHASRIDSPLLASKLLPLKSVVSRVAIFTAWEFHYMIYGTFSLTASDKSRKSAVITMMTPGLLMFVSRRDSRRTIIVDDFLLTKGKGLCASQFSEISSSFSKNSID